MSEGLFSLAHLLLLLFSAIIVLGLPLLFVFLLIRWLGKRQQGKSEGRVSTVGVLIGGVTDIVSSTMLSIPSAVYWMAKSDILHAPGGVNAIASAIQAIPWLYALQLTIGLLCSLLGGYVAARIAKHDEVLNGLLSSFLCTALGLYSMVSGKGSQSVRAQILLLIAAPACALLGGYLRRMQKGITALPAGQIPIT